MEEEERTMTGPTSSELAASSAPPAAVPNLIHSQTQRAVILFILGEHFILVRLDLEPKGIR